MQILYIHTKITNIHTSIAITIRGIFTKIGIQQITKSPLITKKKNIRKY